MNTQRDPMSGVGFPDLSRHPFYSKKTKRFSKAIGDDFFNLSGTLLAEWRDCKTVMANNKAAWDEYNAALDAYNASYSSHNCGTLSPPPAPQLQEKIANPVDECDNMANQKADEMNADMQASYNAALSRYNADKAVCDGLVRPTEPTAQESPISAFSFTGATGDPSMIIHGFQYADGGDSPSDTNPVIPQANKSGLGDLMTILIITGALYIFFNRKKLNW